MHEAAPGPDRLGKGANVPVGHLVHEVAPAAENCPPGQFVHVDSELAPSVLEYFPAGQGVHVAVAAAEKVPGRQNTHVDCAFAPTVGEKFPGPQDVH